MRNLGIVFGVVLACGARPTAAQTTINTFPDTNNVIAAVGESASQTCMGQTFTAGDTPVLRRFRFQIGQEPGFRGTARLRAHLAQWNSRGWVTGPLLYSSDSFTPTSGLPLTTYTFETGNLLLIPGVQYVAFVSALGLEDGVQDGARMGCVTDSDPYPEGHLVTSQSTDLGSLSNPWGSRRDIDLVFSAEFFPEGATAVPEPGALALFLPALGVVAVLRRRRID